MKVSMNSGEKFVTIIHQEVYHRAAKHREIGDKNWCPIPSVLFTSKTTGQRLQYGQVLKPLEHMCVFMVPATLGGGGQALGKNFSRVPSPISLSPRPKTNPSMDQNSVLLSCVLLLSKK